MLRIPLLEPVAIFFNSSSLALVPDVPSKEKSKSHISTLHAGKYDIVEIKKTSFDYQV